jgi:putative tryptophan/tyrosine transport system substrate-binding protein
VGEVCPRQGETVRSRPGPGRPRGDAGLALASSFPGLLGAPLMLATLRAAGLVDKMLEGARPGDLRTEQPTVFEFVMNLKARHRGRPSDLAVAAGTGRSIDRMMDRRSLVAGIVLLLAVPAAGQTQQAERVPQVGVIVVSEPASPTEPNVSAFRQALRDLGYVEGKNIAVQYRYAHGRMERVPELVAELVRLNVDVLVASGPSTVTAKNATRTIPIVFVAMADPVGFGIVASLARPGGNLTGLSFMLDTDFTGKWMELLKEAAPGISRVTYLQDANIPLPVLDQADLRAAAERLGLTLQYVGVRHLGEMDGIFSATTRDRHGSLIVSPAPLFLTHRRQIIKSPRSTGPRPSMGSARSWTTADSCPTA